MEIFFNKNWFLYKNKAFIIRLYCKYFSSANQRTGVRACSSTPVSFACTSSLPNLCACCISDVHTGNVHASGTDTEQLPLSDDIFRKNR